MIRQQQRIFLINTHDVALLYLQSFTSNDVAFGYFSNRTQQTHLRITLVRDSFLATRNFCLCKITRSRNYSPSYQVHMFPRAVMCSSTAYGAVICIRGLASFFDIRISPAFVYFLRVSIFTNAFFMPASH